MTNHENMQLNVPTDHQFPYIVIAREEDGTYGPVLNAQGASLWDAVRWAKTFKQMAGYRRFRVIGLKGATVGEIDFERRNNERRGADRRESK